MNVGQYSIVHGDLGLHSGGDHALHALFCKFSCTGTLNCRAYIPGVILKSYGAALIVRSLS